MRSTRIVCVFSVWILAACARQPRPAAPRPAAAASVFGSHDLVGVTVAPREGDWFDDVIVRTQPAAHVAVFEYSRKGKPQLRVMRGDEVQAVSSIHWRIRGTATAAKPAGFHGPAAGQTACASTGFVPSGVTGTGSIAPISCWDNPARPAYVPAYQSTENAEPRAILVVVADSALRVVDRKALLRQFADARSSPYYLQALAERVVTTGRWAAVVHRPACSSCIAVRTLSSSTGLNESVTHGKRCTKGLRA